VTATSIKPDSPAVATYLGILQGVINRMATNSASCKAWCITLVSAIIVVVADKGKAGYLTIAVFPIILFFVLDAYYLGLERGFRKTYNEFVGKLHESEVAASDLFVVSPGFRTNVANVVQALWSASVWPFYGLLVAMLLAVARVVFPASAK
jgi:hypothetical protein